MIEKPFSGAFISHRAAIPGTINSGIIIFGMAAISGVFRAASFDFDRLARWMSKKSVHQ